MESTDDVVRLPFSGDLIIQIYIYSTSTHMSYMHVNEIMLEFDFIQWYLCSKQSDFCL